MNTWEEHEVKKRKNFIKNVCLRTVKYMVMLAVLLIGVTIISPQDVQAAKKQAKFIDGYSDNNTSISELIINNLIDWYRIKLPQGWKYTDKDITIEVSDKKVAYLEYDANEPDGFYVCNNYNVAYKKYKPVTITATKRNAVTGDETVAKLMVRRYNVSCTPARKTVYEGASFKLTYKMITDTSKKYPVQFDTSDSSVATISKDGIVKAKKAGNAGIVVRNEGGNSVLDLTVKALPSINKKSAAIGIGKSVTLKMNHMPKGTSVTWKSSNTKVATVSNGVVKAKATGKTEITASYKLEGKARQVKCTVTVKGPQLTETTMTLPLRMSKTLKVNNSSGKVKWTTSNQKIATVKDGKITAVGVGKCKITAKANGKTLACNVQVRPNQKSWKVVTRAGYYRDAYDEYLISKVRYNANGSLTVEGYYVNTHIFNIKSFNYMYISVKDSRGRAIASYKTPKFKFKGNSYTVKKLTITIPRSKVRKYVDLSKESPDVYYDCVYNYKY